MKPKFDESLETSQAIQASGQWLTLTIYRFGGFGAVLPFLLPQSRWLVERAPIQLMSQWVPSAAKAGAVATYPHVVQTYIALMFTIAPLLAAYGLLRHTAWRDRCRSYRARPGSPLRKLLVCLAGATLGVSLNLLFYMLPGSVSNAIGNGHGQLLFSLMVTSLPGLAVVGSLLSAAILAIWWIALTSLVLPVLVSFNLE